MVENKILKLIIDNWKDIGLFAGGVWGLFIGGKKLYLNCFVPLKDWIKKMNDAADQLQFNGGNSTKDMVKQIVDGQQAILKKVVDIKNRQIAMVELNDTCLFENDSTGKCISANSALCNLFGATQNKMLGYGWLNFIKNSDHERDMFEQAIETDNEITRNYIILYAGTDKEIPATYIAHIKRDETGAIINVTGKVFIKQ